MRTNVLIVVVFHAHERIDGFQNVGCIAFDLPGGWETAEENFTISLRQDAIIQYQYEAAVRLASYETPEALFKSNDRLGNSEFVEGIAALAFQQLGACLQNGRTWYRERELCEDKTLQGVTLNVDSFPEGRRRKERYLLSSLERLHKLMAGLLALHEAGDSFTK